ncbi:MAG: hypothetical protein IIV45_13195 [Lachnospiraceae bacterium]|nr:hypothetical protein [Lachnospiraceae bacterium]
MRNLFNHQVVRNLVSTILFGVIYGFFNYVAKGTVEMSLIGKSTGHDGNS